MQAIGRRLTYANVVSTLALFLVLAGGAAYAAKVAKKSVGPSQLKANAVTTAKIKANAVTTRKIKRNAVANAKIKNGAIETEKIADGSVALNDLNSSTMPFSRVVQKARGNATLAITKTPKVYPLSEATFTQAATENDTFIGAVDVVFSAGCTSPRSVTAYLLLDSPDPLKLDESEVVAAGMFKDLTGVGALSKRIEIGASGEATGTKFEPGTTRNRKLSLVVEGDCEVLGNGITATFGGANVIATK
jgi:hypothetical protein